jgi:hypothetical protein
MFMLTYVYHHNLLNQMFPSFVQHFFFVWFFLHLLICLCKLANVGIIFAFVDYIFFDLNIYLIIRSSMLSSGTNTFNSCVCIVLHLYPMWLDFNHVSHKVTTNLHTYRNLQLLITSIGGYVMPTKWTATTNDYA